MRAASIPSFHLRGFGPTICGTISIWPIGCGAWRMSSTIAEVVASLAAAFEQAGVEWYLFGAQAALLHGSERMTHDVDVTVLPGDVGTTALLGHLLEHGLSLRVPDDDDFVGQTRVLPMLHEASATPVDVVLGGPGLEQLFAD